MPSVDVTKSGRKNPHLSYSAVLKTGSSSDLELQKACDCKWWTQLEASGNEASWHSCPYLGIRKHDASRGLINICPLEKLPLKASFYAIKKFSPDYWGQVEREILKDEPIVNVTAPAKLPIAKLCCDLSFTMGERNTQLSSVYLETIVAWSHLVLGWFVEQQSITEIP